MKTILSLFLVITFCGCKNFELEKVSSEELLETHVKEMDWNAVDVYPAFESCEDFSEEKAEACFQRIISEQVYNAITGQGFNVSKTLQDTIILELVISKNGQPTLREVLINKNLKEELPELEQLCNSAINSLPKIYPAQKRGVPVATEFKLPIIISAE